MQHMECNDTHFYISHLLRDLIQATHQPALEAFSKITHSLCQRSWRKEKKILVVVFFIDFVLAQRLLHRQRTKYIPVEKLTAT